MNDFVLLGIIFIVFFTIIFVVLAIFNRILPPLPRATNPTGTRPKGEKPEFNGVMFNRVTPGKNPFLIDDE